MSTIEENGRQSDENHEGDRREGRKRERIIVKKVSSSSSAYDRKPFGDTSRPSYGDRPQRPSYGDQQRPSYGDRLQRPSYGDQQRPSYGDRPQRPSYGDQQRPSYGDRPQRPSYGDRPQRPSYGDQQRPSYGDRPQRPSYGDQQRPSYGDRPQRPSYGDRPQRPSYGDQQRPSYGDRPQRPSYGDRPQRPSYGDQQRPSYGDRPQRPAYGDRPQRPYGDRPQRPYGDRPQRPYNNNQGGGFNRGFSKGPGAGGGYNKFKKPFAPRTYPPMQPQRPMEYKSITFDPNEPIRLNKYLANAGVCSRREADEYIQAGVVSVNGTVVTELGHKVLRADRVLFHDQLVKLEKKVYVLLNKPKDCVTTVDDPEARLTVMDLVKGSCDERIYPVGRLDRNTTGVLLLTNDGDLAAKLAHPKFDKKKVYHVWLDKDIPEEDLLKIAEGVELSDGMVNADAISYATEMDRNQVGIEIHSGKNRVVRRIFEAMGYHVLKLDRVLFAGLTKKNIRRGQWRYLTEDEVNMLRMGAYE